ncbi:MAG: putative Ig domain-containing protein [Nitrospirae bacterium]|nr:putative Ig domain-containing protein [Nitrospirota bacterium]
MKQKIKKLFTIHPSLVIPGTGFTLIEIAIVLVILGLLIGLGVQLIGPLTKRVKLEETREAVKAAKETVKGNVVKNGFLPATLEAAGARKLDAWGRDMLFYRAVEFDTSGEDPCGATTTTLGGQPFDVYECTNDDCSSYNTKSNIGFIVFSKGEDANEAGTDPGKDGVPPFYVRIQDSTYTDTTTYNYDDVVEYVSLDQIRSLKDCAQTLTTTSPNALSQGEEDAYYSYSMQAIGGKSPYIWGDGTLWSSSGLSLNTSGLISGTLNYNGSSTTGELANCTETITIPKAELKVTDSANATYTSASDFTITVAPRALSITTQTLPDANTRSGYSVTLNKQGGRSSYTWSVSGQTAGTFGCAAGSYPITGSNTGLCLVSSTGILSGTPSAAGTYSFTVTVNDTCTTASKAFTLNVLVTCGYSGITVRNSTGVIRGYRENGGGCVSWGINATVNLLPTDYLNVYTAGTCATATCGTYPVRITYSLGQSIDVDTDCAIGLTAVAATCAFSDE